MAKTDKLRSKLREAGFTNPMIDAAWPTWWSDEAAESPSANAELVFSVSRKLGLSASELLDDSVEFVWRDEARFKHFRDDSDNLRSILSSFGISIARILSGIQPSQAYDFSNANAENLRSIALKNQAFIDLRVLLSICWSIGIPVLHLRVFPHGKKSMHAMAVRSNDFHAILLARDSEYPAHIAFTLAHELGHIVLGHLTETSEIVDWEDSERGLPAANDDKEEAEADKFALELLTGASNLQFEIDRPEINSAQLAKAVLDASTSARIEPGTLALCYAFQSGKWPIANAAMKYIYDIRKPVWREVNNLAYSELKLGELHTDSCDYLIQVMGLPE